MTNGKKMQAVFPDIEMWGESKDTLDYSLGGMIHRVTKSWRNTEYKEPKTVLYSGDGYADGYMVYDMAECPNCGYEYEDGDKDWGLSFCPSCGQKLNWESEEV